MVTEERSTDGLGEYLVIFDEEYSQGSEACSKWQMIHADRTNLHVQTFGHPAAFEQDSREIPELGISPCFSEYT